jgi:hypothetical protein
VACSRNGARSIRLERSEATTSSQRSVMRLMLGSPARAADVARGGAGATATA